MLRDLRSVLRSLSRSPWYALGMGLILALGLGVNLALGSVFYQQVIRPFDGPAPERLVDLPIFAREDARGGSASPAVFRLLQGEGRTLSHLAASAHRTGVLELPDRAVRARYTRLSASAFPMLGLPAWFGPEGDLAGAAPRVVLTHEGWMRRFGGDPGILGRTLRLDGVDRPVVGILPADFRMPGDLRPGDLIVPLALTPEELERQGTSFLNLVGRLKDGVSLAAAETELAGLYDRLERARSGVGHGSRLRLERVLDTHVQARSSLLVLMGLSMGLILAIACANAANLALARWGARTRELGLRSALGAGRAAALRPLLLESAVLVILGGAEALLLQTVFLRILRGFLLADLPTVARATPPFLVAVLLAGLVALALGLLLVPLAWTLRRLDPAHALREGRGTAAPAQSRLRTTLVVAQVATATTLLATSLLLVRSLGALAAVPLGFDAQGVLTATVELPRAAYGTPEAQAAFQTRLLERAGGLPGVQHVGLMDHLPMGGSLWTSTFEVDGLKDNRHLPPAQIHLAGGALFDALRIPLAAGRGLAVGEADACVVNETLARRVWPGQDPLGRTVRLHQRDLRVVGVAQDTRTARFSEAPRQQIYAPLGLQPSRTFALVLRGSGASAVLAPGVRALVRALDAGVALDDPAPLTRNLERQLQGFRGINAVFGSLAALALVLAVLGLGGALALTVVQRTSEIGVRMALGARAVQIVRMVLAQGLRQIALGLALGLPAAWGLGTLLRSILFGIQPGDPRALGAAVLLLAVSGLGAALIPALRAARVDPAVALRSE